MTYQQHLRSVILALKNGPPPRSDRRISVDAGLNASWVSTFMTSGSATFESAARIIELARAVCPDGAEGDALRELLRAFERDIDQESAA